MQLEMATMQTARCTPCFQTPGRKDTPIRREATFIHVTCETLDRLLNAAALAIKMGIHVNKLCMLT